MAVYNNLALSPEFSLFPPPVYPLFLRGIYGIFGQQAYTAVFAVQGVLGAISVLLVYRIAERAGGRAAGLVAAAVAAFYPNLVAYGLTTLTETLSVFIALLILDILCGKGGERVRSAAVAALLVIGFLVRPAFAFFGPGVLVATRRRVVFVITAAALLAPVIVAGVSHGGGIGAVLFYKTYNETSDGRHYVDIEDTAIGKDDLPASVYLSAALRFILRHGWRTVDIVYNKASVLVSRGFDTFILHEVIGDGPFMTNVFMYAYLPVMVLGLVGLVRYAGGPASPVTAMLVSYTVLNVLLSVFKWRYRLLIEPMLIVFASILLTRAFTECRRSIHGDET